MEFFLREIYPWLIEVSSFSSILPFTVSLFLIRKYKNIQFRLLFLFVLFNVAVEAAGQITVFLGTRNNIWISHMATPLEFTILATFFYHSFRRPLLKKTIVIATVAFILLCIGNSVFGEGIAQMNSLPRMLGNSLLIAISILYFYKVANDKNIIYLDRDPVFLLSCFLLVYKAGSSMSWAMFNTALAESYDAARMCIAIVLVLNIFFNSSLVFVLKRTPAG